jgi:murein DD-endopeptidase MepM/ murein hydrolase activator NlpD
VTTSELIKAALHELQQTTLGYEEAKRQNPKGFPGTHNGRCEAYLHLAFNGLIPPPAPAQPTIQLPEHFTPTHQTSGLPGYPAIDVFAQGGTVALAPANGTITRLSGHPVTPTAVPGGPYGLSCYLTRDGGGVYFCTHFATLRVKLGQKVTKGTPLGTVADYSRATGGATPSHIHEGLHP